MSRRGWRGWPERPFVVSGTVIPDEMRAALACLDAGDTECGVCSYRCPFSVDVVANMQRAIRVFGN